MTVQLCVCDLLIVVDKGDRVCCFFNLNLKQFIETTRRAKVDLCIVPLGYQLATCFPTQQLHVAQWLFEIARDRRKSSFK